MRIGCQLLGRRDVAALPVKQPPKRIVDDSAEDWRIENGLPCVCRRQNRFVAEYEEQEGGAKADSEKTGYDRDSHDSRSFHKPIHNGSS